MSKNKTAAVQSENEKKSGGRKDTIFGSPVRNLLIIAIVSFLLGIAFMVKADLVYIYCGYVIGGLIAIVGLIYIVIYFARYPVDGEYRYEFGIGLVALLVGIYVAFGGIFSNNINSVSSMGIGFSIIVKIIGVLITLDGVMKLQYALDLARMKYPRWWVTLVVGILGIALGVVTVMGYTYDVGYLMRLNTIAFLSGMLSLGLAFCINGILDLIAMFAVLSRNRIARRDAAIAEGTAIVAAARQEEIESAIPAPVEEVYVPAPEPEAAPPAEPVIPEAPAPEAAPPAAMPAQAVPADEA